MEYKCKTINTSQLIATPVGFMMPLCEKCQVQDCTNPIEQIKMSILGITIKVKVFNLGSESKFVVQCEGYLSNV